METMIARLRALAAKNPEKFQDRLDQLLVAAARTAFGEKRYEDRLAAFNQRMEEARQVRAVELAPTKEEARQRLDAVRARKEQEATDTGK